MNTRFWTPPEIYQLWVTRTDNHPNAEFPGGTADYITVHETDNWNPGADAAAHAAWMYSPTGAPYAWHETVDDKEIWQSIPVTMQGWHAGDGLYGLGNTESIGIEICVFKGIDQERAYLNAAWRIAQLLRDGHGRLGVVQHNFWTGKHCPRGLRDNGLWDWFLGRISFFKEGPVVEGKQEDYARALNRAVMQRNDLIHIASGDYDKVKLAHAILVEKGLVPVRD